MNIWELDGKSEKVGEAMAATAKVNNSGTKVYFKMGGNVGTVTWEIARNKWYGSARLIPAVKRAFGIK